MEPTPALLRLTYSPTMSAMLVRDRTSSISLRRIRPATNRFYGREPAHSAAGMVVGIPGHPPPCDGADGECRDRVVLCRSDSRRHRGRGLLRLLRICHGRAFTRQ